MSVYDSTVPRFMDLPVDEAVAQLEAVSRRQPQKSITGVMRIHPRKAVINNGVIYFNVSTFIFFE